LNDFLMYLCVGALVALAVVSLIPVHLKQKQRVWGLYLPLLSIPIFFLYDAWLPRLVKSSGFMEVDLSGRMEYPLARPVMLFILMNTLAKWVFRWYVEFKPIARSRFGAKLTGRIMQLSVLLPILVLIWSLL